MPSRVIFTELTPSYDSTISECNGEEAQDGDAHAADPGRASIGAAGRGAERPPVGQRPGRGAALEISPEGRGVIVSSKACSDRVVRRLRALSARPSSSS